MGINKDNLNDLTRVAVYAKDIELLTGRTDRYARNVMQKIRQRHGKTKDQLVSVSELAAYLGLPLEDVISQLMLRR
jgi:hypothetical protein